LHFSKPFQIQRVFVQAFPNKALAVLWDFKELQASKSQSDVSPNFCGLAPFFSRIPNAAAPHSAASRRMGFEAGPPFAGVCDAERVGCADAAEPIWSACRFVRRDDGDNFHVS
jgi:hypothetical protein